MDNELPNNTFDNNTVILAQEMADESRDKTKKRLVDELNQLKGKIEELETKYGYVLEFMTDNVVTQDKPAAGGHRHLL